MSSLKRNLFFLTICLLNISPFHEAARPSTGLQEPRENGALLLGSMNKGVFPPYSGSSGRTYVGKKGRASHIHPKNFAGDVQQKSSNGLIVSTIRGLAPPSEPSSCTYTGKNGEDCPINGKMSVQNIYGGSKNLTLESIKKRLVPPSGPSSCTKTGKILGGDCPIHRNALPKNVHRENSSSLMQLESMKKGLVSPSGPSSCRYLGSNNGGECPIYGKISKESVLPKGLLPPPSDGPSDCMSASNRGGECHVQGKNFAGGVGIDSSSIASPMHSSSP